jgi:alpha-galactosidase
MTGEKPMTENWVNTHFLNTDAQLPFSFQYGGKSATEWLAQSSRSVTALPPSVGAASFRLNWTEAQAGLSVTCEVMHFHDFPAVEWTVFLKNTGTADSGVIEDVQPLDIGLTRAQEAEFVLHHHRGSSCEKTDFLPLVQGLGPYAEKQLACIGGRSSDGTLPFFSLDYDGACIIFGIGWSGGWAASLARDAEKGIQIRAGMKQTHFRLHPGEEVRTPRILMFFSDTPAGASRQNQFRKFILSHHTPQANGQPVQLPLAASTWHKHNCGNGVTEQNQKEFIAHVVSAGIPLECYWLDAGWYDGVGNWAFDVGNWFPKKTAFPNGLKPVGETAQKQGMGFVLWFEPERVYAGTWLYEHHPEWLLFPDAPTRQQRQRLVPQAEAVLDLGNPDARHWLTEHVSNVIAESGVTIYRQDFNFDPWGYWQSADAPDRQGITEIRYIQGLYAFWDGLRQRHPGLVVDNCASGGRRLDLETISRSVALWRSDYAFEPEGSQCHTLGLLPWLPCCSGGCHTTDPYFFRSSLAAGISLAWDFEKSDFDVAAAQKRVAEFIRLRPLFYGDFYPLTEPSPNADVWCAYQLDRPDLNQGAVLAFRREKSPHAAGKLKLYGLKPDAQYLLHDVDADRRQTLAGATLMTEGLDVQISSRPGSALFLYEAMRSEDAPGQVGCHSSERDASQ